jgi:hypothetical protein
VIGLIFGLVVVVAGIIVVVIIARVRAENRRMLRPRVILGLIFVPAFVVVFGSVIGVVGYAAYRLLQAS